VGRVPNEQSVGDAGDEPSRERVTRPSGIKGDRRSSRDLLDCGGLKHHNPSITQGNCTFTTSPLGIMDRPPPAVLAAECSELLCISYQDRDSFEDTEQLTSNHPDTLRRAKAKYKPTGQPHFTHQDSAKNNKCGLHHGV
jgi:hypothetical protein